LRNDSTAADTAPSFPVLVPGMVNSLVKGRSLGYVKAAGLRTE
jgi:hypothetical protein